MKVLDKEEETEYSTFMENVCTTVLKESFLSIKEMHEHNVDARLNSEEIGMAMGQICLDQIIDMTKEMDRDRLVRYLAEIAIASAVNTMQSHPVYKMKLIQQLGLL